MCRKRRWWDDGVGAMVAMGGLAGALVVGVFAINWNLADEALDKLSSKARTEPTPTCVYRQARPDPRGIRFAEPGEYDRVMAATRRAQCRAGR